MNIIACGPTASLWDGSGESIGVNDCEKFGKPVGALVCINSKFTHDRERIIKNTKAPLGFYSHLVYWASQPNFRVLPTMIQFKLRKRVELNRLYSSTSSPFVAMSLAVTQGHKEIVLHGVDFDNHPIIKGGVMMAEVENYKNFIHQLDLLGIKVYLSQDFGALKGFLPVWKKG